MAIDEELIRMKCKLGVLKEEPCPEWENRAYRTMLKQGKPLPEGVYKDTNYDDEEAEFYTIQKTGKSEEETSEYLMLKQLEAIISIKKWVTFFGVLTIISLIISAVTVMLAVS